MKLLFSADIHIRLGSKNVPLEWAKNRFQMFIDQFQEMQKQADLVVIGGDVFDRLPTMDEVELYFDLVASIKKPCVIYAGNHEAAKKDTTFLSFLKKSTHRLNPLVRIIDEYETNVAHNVNFIPYNKLKDFEKNGYPLEKYDIVCSHFRAEIPPHVKPEIDLDLFNDWKVVLAGDLHSYENSQRNILYPGSPYTTSFHRSEVDTGAILLDTESLDHVWLKFNLPQLIKKTVSAANAGNLQMSDFHHTIYEVEGDLHQLSSLEDSELIDKKVTKRSNDAQLILDPQLSLAEEVREYLTYILELPEGTIANILKEYYNHAGKFEV